jgi:hypothetical protein
VCECHSKQPKKEEVAYTAQDEEQSLLLAELETVDPLTVGDYSGIHISGDGSGLLSNVSGEVKSAVAQPLDLADTCVLHGAAAKRAIAAARVQSTDSKSAGEELVHIIEQKVYADVHDEEDKDPQRWVLDTGASNHMTGSRATFATIDTRTAGTEIRRRVSHAN